MPKHSVGLNRRALVKTICRLAEQELTSATPSPAALCEAIRRTCSLSPEDAELTVYQLTANLNREYFSPISHLELVVTERCNLRCTYCFERRMQRQQDMTAQTARSALRLLFDYSAAARDLRIVFFGGEPLLNVPVIEEVVSLARTMADAAGKRVSFDMTTNGTLMTDHLAAYFARNGVAPLISIDGDKASHDASRRDAAGNGTFDRAVRALAFVAEHGQRLGIKMTVAPCNAARLCEDVHALYRRGVRHFVVGHATGVPWTDKNRAVYAEQLCMLLRWRDSLGDANLTFGGDPVPSAGTGAHFGCRAGRSSITVAPDGQLTGCSKILALDNRHLICRLGDVRWGLYHFRNRLEIHSAFRLKERCEQLGIARDYKGGCFAANYEESNDMYHPSLQEYSFSKARSSVLQTAEGPHTAVS